MTRRMKLSATVISLGSICLISAGFVFYYSTPTNNLLANYPNSPFEKAPSDSPRIFIDNEKPLKTDEQGLKAFFETNKKIVEYIKTQGSEKDATAEERKALDACWDGKSIRSRELSESILRSNPRSIPAMYVRAKALVDGDSNPAAALHQYQILRRYLEQIGRKNPADSQAREWYLRSLAEENDVLRSLGRDAEALRCAELIEQTYGPRPWLKTWSYFRLNRLDEAEQAIIAVEATGNWKRRTVNDRATLAYLRFDRTRSYECYKQLAELDPDTEVYVSNYASAALLEFKPAEAKEAYLKATQLFKRWFNYSRYSSLASLALEEGQFADAFESLKKAQGQRAHRDPSTWQFDRSAIDWTLAAALLNINRLADSERFARRAFDSPDRHRNSTANTTERELSATVSLWSVLQCRIAALKELEVVDKTFGWSYRQRRSLQMECWKLEKRIAKLLEEERLVRMTFMPKFGCSPQALFKILPKGVALTSIQFARKSDNHPGTVAYYEESLAEVAFYHGDWNEAIRLSKAASEKLPSDFEKSLICRLQAISAISEMKLGHTLKCLELMDSVLGSHPVLLRELDAQLPVNIETDGSTAARELSRLLAKSPRMKVDPKGFPLNIRSVDGQLTVQMSRLNNVRHLEKSVPIKSDATHAAAVTLYYQLHEQLTTPNVTLDQSVINSLDGSPVAAAERAQIGELLQISNNRK